VATRKSQQDDRSPLSADLDEDTDATGQTVAGARETDRPRRRRIRRRTPNSGDLFFLLALFSLVLVVVLVGFRDLTSLIYSRWAGIILLITVIQYLVLKSMDRTRVYQMENQRLRDLRRTDRLMLRRARDIIEDRLAAEPAPPAAEDNEEKSRWRTRAEEVVRDIAGSI
jgi:hypothetical protein